MNDRDQRRYDRALRVQTFGKEHVGDFPPTSIVPGFFASLDKLIEDIIQAKAGQDPNHFSKETLLEALNEDFGNISRTAQAIALVEPGFATPYLVPENPAEGTRLTHADSLLKLLEDNDKPLAEGGDTPEQKAAKAAIRAKFIAYLMPDDFVEDLRSDTDAIRAVNQQNRGGAQGGVENTTAIGLLLGQCADIVQHLDAAMHNKYARKPERLRAWKSARRVESAPQRKKKDKPATTPPNNPPA
ncbi:MAG: hypothetical protein ACOYMN_13795 [Roseimicrobium sp.]